MSMQVHTSISEFRCPFFPKLQFRRRFDPSLLKASEFHKRILRVPKPIIHRFPASAYGNSTSLNLRYVAIGMVALPVMGLIGLFFASAVNK